MKKKVVAGIVLTLLLTPMILMMAMIQVGVIAAMPVGGGFPPYESSPQATSYSGIGTPTALASSYDKETDTDCSFYMVYAMEPQGIVEWNTFEDTPSYGQFPIAWLDLKIKYKVPTATIDDKYRIEYKVEPDATWIVLQPDVAGKRFDMQGTSRARPWANLDEPNDGLWDWTDINSLRVRVVGTRVGAESDMKKMYVAEIWLSIYDYAPPVVSPTMSVMPMHRTTVFDWDTIFVDVYVRDVTEMLGFTIVLTFDPSVLMAADFMVYHPFETEVIREIGADYVSVQHVTFYGDDTGFSGDTPLVRIWFYVMVGSGSSDLTLSKHILTDIYGQPIANTAFDGDYNEYGVTIESVSRTPVTPSYDEEVTVTAVIRDDDGGIDKAILSYTFGITWFETSMDQEYDIFNATIPPQPYGTFVQYQIYANDTDGNWDESDVFSYTVVDIVEPQIEISREPVQPREGQSAKVLADVFEPVNASGVKTVLFSYRVNNGPWWNTTMVFNETLGLYESTIPPGQQAHDVVEYFLTAEDNAGNENTTETYSYIVALGGDANLDHTVDIYDIGVISAHWYPGPPIGPLGYSYNYDLNSDGAIDIFDIGIVSAHWGESW